MWHLPCQHEGGNAKIGADITDIRIGRQNCASKRSQTLMGGNITLQLEKGFIIRVARYAEMAAKQVNFLPIH
jgi:hypothetical protein